MSTAIRVSYLLSFPGRSAECFATHLLGIDLIEFLNCPRSGQSGGYADLSILAAYFAIGCQPNDASTARFDRTHTRSRAMLARTCTLVVVVGRCVHVGAYVGPLSETGRRARARTPSAHPLLAGLLRVISLMTCQSVLARPNCFRHRRRLASARP